MYAFVMAKSSKPRNARPAASAQTRGLMEHRRSGRAGVHADQNGVHHAAAGRTNRVSSRAGARRAASADAR